MDPIDRAVLDRVAYQAMLDYGLTPDFTPAAQAQAEALADNRQSLDDGTDLRHLPWTSIDNPESRDLDQIEALEPQGDGTRLYVAIADVASAVPAFSPIDQHAGTNTTSVYTGVRVFTMLPTLLSYDLTSLLPGQARRAMVVDMRLTAAGNLETASVYPALVNNRAKLDYPAVSRWLEGGPAPASLSDDRVLQEQLTSQDALAQVLRKSRMAAGALDLDTGELRPVLSAAGEVIGLESRPQDRAGSIIEEFMIASNRAVVRWLSEADLPCLLRVVRRPRHWDRIMEYAAARGVILPAEADSRALSGFLERMRQRRPHEFHEISLSIVKLIGRGEYAAHRPGAPPIGHFGLGTPEYGHATAPNRRYPDLVMHRLLAGDKAAADFGDLEEIARRCSTMEAQAEKVQRRVHKSIAAALIADRVGEVFDGVITKADQDKVFIHVFHPAAQGIVIDGLDHVRVGDKVRVRLVRVDIEQSLIDFVLAI